jgi:hypothetical protein
MFEKKGLNVSQLERVRGELVHVHLETDRQAGDIAGTKLKKFARFLEGGIGRYFVVRRSEFVYHDSQEADVYFVVEPRNEVLRRGPAVGMKEGVAAFRKVNSGAFERGGFWFVKEEVPKNGKDWLQMFLGENKKVVSEMGITEIEVC